MNTTLPIRLAVAATLALALAGCYRVIPSMGGGQVAAPGPRTPNAADVALPAGYQIEVVARGLTFPTGVAFDAEGRPYVVESGYSYGEVFTTPRLLRVDANGALTPIATGGRNGPWTGVAFHNGQFFVAEGGVMEGGRIIRIGADGAITRLVENLPSFGDHHTNGPAIGPDGSVYFAIGTATNAAVVGTDNAKFGWLKRQPKFHDVPCRDVTLAGHNFDTPAAEGMPAATTGAYVPFGTPTQAGQVVKGQVPCSGAILRVPAAGGPPDLVAWGLRNPFGLAVGPDGALYATENSYDDRGSRPVWGTPDVMWRITPGTWYGWPDFAEGRPVTDPAYDPPTKPKPRPVLASTPGTPPQPVARFGVHASANGFDFSRAEAFGHVGQAFVALLGDEAPTTGKVVGPVGFKVVRVDIAKGLVEDFAVNRGGHGPASKINTGGLERPVAARFDPTGRALYVVDFGVLQHAPDAKPHTGTGVLWRIARRAS